MCFFSAPKMSPPPLPPAPPPVPTVADPALGKARESNMRLAALSLGRDKTILTSSQGLESTNTNLKKTLGS